MNSVRPYTREIQFQVTAGQHNTVVLPVPPRGFLARFIIRQVGGTFSGYSYDIYSRLEACEIAAGDSVSSADDYGPAMYKLQATQTVAGGTGTNSQYGLDIPYENRDDQDQRKTPKSSLYLDLQPGGSGHKDFEVSITVTQLLG